ncbi:MAG: PilZ domain-containing protein [Acidobacteriota bacterium]
MTIEKRRFIRFSLDIPAFRYAEEGEELQVMIRQLSVGGCQADWNESIFPDNEFRFEFPLPNKNRLPLTGKVIYRLPGKWIGIKFEDISRFEQELLASIISDSLEGAGLPLLVDPFTAPPGYVGEDARRDAITERLREETTAV